jgi:hypothetical protein
MLAKFFLWIVGMSIPVVIAACYGPSMRYQKDGQPEGKPTGQVIDRNSPTMMDSAFLMSSVPNG